MRKTEMREGEFYAYHSGYRYRYNRREPGVVRAGDHASRAYVVSLERHMQTGTMVPEDSYFHSGFRGRGYGTGFIVIFCGTKESTEQDLAGLRASHLTRAKVDELQREGYVVTLLDTTGGFLGTWDEWTAKRDEARARQAAQREAELAFEKQIDDRLAQLEEMRLELKKKLDNLYATGNGVSLTVGPVNAGSEILPVSEVLVTLSVGDLLALLEEENLLPMLEHKQADS